MIGAKQLRFAAWIACAFVATGAGAWQERPDEPSTIDGVSLDDWGQRIFEAKPEEQSALLDRLLPLVKSGPSLARALAASQLASHARMLERHGPRFELAIVTLLELAGGDDLPAARTAMQALSSSARVEPRVVDAAVARLTSSDVELRRAATWALASALPSDSRCESKLRERLVDADAQVRCAAATALIAEGAKDDVVVGVFVELARCDDAYARSSVLANFGMLGNDFLNAQLPLLLEKLRSDSSTDCGNAALWISTLGEAGYEVLDAVPALLELARDSNGWAREAAARALGVIGATTEQAVPALAALLVDPSSSVRYSALASLAQAGEEVVLALPELIAALDHVDAQQRAAVANLIALGGARSATAVEALQRRLADPVANVRTWSAFALRSIGAPSLPALSAFERMVREEPDAKARLEAVRAIAALGSLAGGVAEPVAAACRDPDRDVQLWSLFALGELGVVSEATRAALQAALASGDDALAEEAAKAAAKLGLGEEAGGAAEDAAETAAAARAAGTPQTRSAPLSAPVVYDELALVLVDARGAAIVDFDAPYTTVDDGMERCGVRVRWRYLARGQSKATEGSDDAFERRWVSGNSINTKSDLAPGQVDSSAAWLDAGPLRLQWSNRGNGSGWIYWRPEELRVELANEGDFETLDLARFLGGAEPPAQGTSEDGAPPTDSAQAWLDWHRALDLVELRRRVEACATAPPQLPRDWLAEVALALHDPSPELRALACFAIGARFTEASEYTELLRACAANDEVSLVRYAAAFAQLCVTQAPAPVAASAIALLQADDPWVRLQSATLLGELDDEVEQSVPALIVLLARPADGAADRTVRRATAEALGKLRQYRPAAEALRDRLSDGDGVVAAWALLAATRQEAMTPELVSRAVALLREDDVMARRVTASALSGATGELPPAVITALQHALFDGDDRVRQIATFRAVPVAFPAVSTPDRSAWPAAVFAFGDRDQKVRLLALSALQRERCGGPAELIVPLLLRAAREDADAEWVRPIAAATLVTWGGALEPWIEELGPLLEAKSGDVALQLPLVLAEFGEKAQPQQAALARMAAEGQGLVAVTSAFALDAIEEGSAAVDESNRGGVAHGAQRPNGSRLRAALADLDFDPAAGAPFGSARGQGWNGCLEKCPSREVVARLAMALEAASSDERPEVRAAALWSREALFGFAAPSLFPALTAAVADPSPPVRRVVAALLAGLAVERHSERTLDAVRTLLTDDVPDVRDAALRGLLAQPPEVSLPSVTAPLVAKLVECSDLALLEWGARALFLLGERSDTAFELLERLARHSDPSVRAAAEEALASLR